MTALGIELTGLGPDGEVNLWRLEVRDELPEPNPKVKDFPGWWEGAPKTYVLAEAKRLWENAADLGHVKAMTLLGCALIGGGDLAGRDWLKRASDLGDLDAVFHLGLSWQEIDPKRALEFLFASGREGPPECHGPVWRRASCNTTGRSDALAPRGRFTGRRNSAV